MYVVICPRCGTPSEVYFELLVFDCTGWPKPVRCEVCNGTIEPYLDELQVVPAVTQAS